MARVHKSMFPGLFFNQYLTNPESIILTLASKSYYCSHNPEQQGGKPLLPVLKTLVCRSQGANPRPPAPLVDTLTTRPLQWLTNLRKKAFEHTVDTEENDGNQHFLLFPQCFLSFSKQILIFRLHLLCHLQMLLNLDLSKILSFGKDLMHDLCNALYQPSQSY